MRVRRAADAPAEWRRGADRRDLAPAAGASRTPGHKGATRARRCFVP